MAFSRRSEELDETVVVANEAGETMELLIFQTWLEYPAPLNQPRRRARGVKSVRDEFGNHYNTRDAVEFRSLDGELFRRVDPVIQG